MLVIKTLMVGASVLLLFYFFVSARGRPVEKLGMSLVFLSIAFFALFPSIADRVASFVGVDRGADLMLYLATMALLFLSFHLYLRQKDLEGELRIVVRQLALQQVSEPETADRPSDDEATQRHLARSDIASTQEPVESD